MTSRGRAATAFALVAMAAFVGALIASAATTFADDAVLRLCSDALITEIWVATIAVAVALFAARPLRISLGLHPGRMQAREIGLMVLGTLATSHALDGWLEISGLGEESVLLELPRTLEHAEGMALVAALLALGLAPAIAEELLCRGLIQRGVTRRLGPLAGVLFSAVLFGALHVEPIHAGFATLLGLYLGAAAHWSGSTRVPMVCHAANNLSAVGLAAASGPGWASPLTTAASAVVALVCLGWVARRHPPGRASPL